MKLFTFSGIRADLQGFNQGEALLQFAQDIIAHWSSLPGYTGIPAPSYDPATNHFVSEINLGQVLAELGNIFTLDGGSTLNNEAQKFQQPYAEKFKLQCAQETDIVILAHSQGTNICIYVLDYLADLYPSFFENRSVRCAFFDPKVSIAKINDLRSTLDPRWVDQVNFLYFQSQNDLLDNQNFHGKKFIDEYLIGNHLFVQGLDHSTICQWGSATTPESMSCPERKLLTSSGYFKYKVDYQKEIDRRNRISTKGVRDFISRDTFLAGYPMISGPASTPLLQFLQDRTMDPIYLS